jgi:dihydroorotate dehydrogenase (fumarate)
MIDLSTKYLGLELKSPLVASASPISRRVDTVQRLEQAGIAAVVMYSLFEEQIIHESLELHHHLEQGTEHFAEALNYLPDMGTYSIGSETYLENLREIKASVGIPVIGSLNGISTGGWIRYARMIEEAGADALELNLYDVENDPNITSSELEARDITLVRDIRKEISIPIAVKLSPFFTSLPNFARRLVEVGADGLVLFNRFYQPDFDLDHLEVVPHLVLSNSNELRLPLRWIALLYGQIDCDFALSSGIHTAEDVLKAMMSGARVAMMTSALFYNGVDHVKVILDDLRAWMEENEYESIQMMQGSMSQQGLGKSGPLERANYIRELNSYDMSDPANMRTAIASRLFYPPLESPSQSDA